MFGDLEKELKKPNKSKTKTTEEGKKEKKESVSNENEMVIPPKQPKVLEKLMKKKTEEKVLLGVRVNKSVDDGLEALVKQAKDGGYKTSKQELVNEILKKELGL
ncbi:hypothetical protein [Rossellomorea marisflavi]|uniref:hypothetical protein n=1 Tax=Rossellomorea marisflavi TaxID=189381 RepID=UPI001EE15F11|nr:hypothetical protein [Rossellomorea marisflavi]UKS67700.1 hypothetical protein K6T23_22105 [Rossellomorea marisflavi]